jgi:hypothetical protein
MTQQLHVEQRHVQLPELAIARFLPFALLLLMGIGFFLIDAILPLQGIRSYDALLYSQISTNFLLPTHVLFPGWVVLPLIPGKPSPHKPLIVNSWPETAMLLGAFVVVFLLYLFALRYLPKFISRNYLFTSTLVLGFLCILMPVLTSSDLFSYIAYARIAVIYHLNPLVTWPAEIPSRSDPIIPYVYWLNQPSAYGPVWAIITSFFQWILGSAGPVRMVIALRLLGLTMHLSSTALIWSISGYLQRLTGSISPEQRIRATLAFAWNPLLLYEVCVNAHVDATLLFLILLAIWFLVSRRTSTIQSYLLAAATLAVATCVKINIVLLVPGLLLFLYLRWPFNVRPVLAAAATYVGTIILLYVPFWRGKATLDVILVNPNSSQNINSLADFLSRLYNSVMHMYGYPLASTTYTPSEGVTHIIGMASFAFVYLILCWRAIRAPKRINTIPGLIRWMALVWLLYCAIGSPWYWPWYLVTFFGLFALVEATHTRKEWSFSFLRLPLATRLLAFSMLSLYCFYTWGPLYTYVTGLPGFLWNYVCGLWIWILPLLAFRLRSMSKVSLATQPQLSELPSLQKQEVQAVRN